MISSIAAHRPRARGVIASPPTQPRGRRAAAQRLAAIRIRASRLRGLAQLVAVERANLLPVDLQHPVRQIGNWHLQRIVGCCGRFSMQCSISAINVASLYVAVRRPVSRIATTRCPSNNGSAASPSTRAPRCQRRAVELHHALSRREETRMGKLVRDTIPDIIRDSGRHRAHDDARRRRIPRGPARQTARRGRRTRRGGGRTTPSSKKPPTSSKCSPRSPPNTAQPSIPSSTSRYGKRAERGGFDMRLWLRRRQTHDRSEPSDHHRHARPHASPTAPSARSGRRWSINSNPTTS